MLVTMHETIKNMQLIKSTNYLNIIHLIFVVGKFRMVKIGNVLHAGKF